jgi:hypothetical protein
MAPDQDKLLLIGVPIEINEKVRQALMLNVVRFKNVGLLYRLQG